MYRKITLYSSLDVVQYIFFSRKYYEPYALVYNCVQGPILASLIGKLTSNFIYQLFHLIVLVGPCALEFTGVKTSDHLWTDPHANELVQRHRMHSSNRTVTNATAMMINVENSHSPKFRPKLQINVRKNLEIIYLNVNCNNII